MFEVTEENKKEAEEILSYLLLSEWIEFDGDKLGLVISRDNFIEALAEALMFKETYGKLLNKNEEELVLEE
jgi:hypothetical protein